jgi:aminoglycoside phosphotransferase (APT) family kinase protein
MSGPLTGAGLAPVSDSDARLREALCRLRRGSGWLGAPPAETAVCLGRLQPGGLSNDNVLLRAGSEILVLRLDGIDPRVNSLDRRAELRILRAAAEAGIAPAPRFSAPEAGILVTRYLPPDPGAGTARAEDLAALLRTIHALAVPAPALALVPRLERYRAVVAEASPGHALLQPGLADSMQATAAALDTLPGGAALCHNDLSPGNLLTHRRRLIALDWEYAASGCRWLDIATAARQWAPADDAAGEQLLAQYLQHPPEPAEREWLLRAAALAGYLESLWLAANGRERPVGAGDRA